MSEDTTVKAFALADELHRAGRGYSWLHLRGLEALIARLVTAESLTDEGREELDHLIDRYKREGWRDRSIATVPSLPPLPQESWAPFRQETLSRLKDNP